MSVLLPKTIKEFIRVARAHLPTERKLWYVETRLLDESLTLLEDQNWKLDFAIGILEAIEEDLKKEGKEVPHFIWGGLLKLKDSK